MATSNRRVSWTMVLRPPGRSGVRISLLLAGMTLALMATRTHAGTGFIETFAEDPVAAGRFQLHEGDASRWAYDATSHTLLARYDTLKPTTRLIHPLCRPLTQSDSFEFRVEFRACSAGFLADPRRNAQIAFGLMNSATTGTDRVYGRDGQGAFDLVSFDYFPNVSMFGGPSAGTTIITTDTGIGFASSINFGFGPETQMNDPGEGPLPLDEWLTAVVSYAGPARRATLRVLDAGVPLPINAVGSDYDPGGSDGDPATIVTDLSGAGFTVDSFGLLLWADTSASFATLIADVDYRWVSVTWSAGGDFDHDGDVDAADYDHFQACMTAPAVPQRDSACLDADLDCDGDVDQEDFGQLQAGMTSQP